MVNERVYTTEMIGMDLGSEDKTVISVQSRSGITHIYTLKPDEDFRIVENVGLVIVHPDRRPRVIHYDGREEEIEPIFDPVSVVFIDQYLVGEE